MTFEILFDEEIYREQIKLTFDTSWKNSLRKNKEEAIIGSVLSCLGVAAIYGKGNIGILFLLMGIMCIINVVIRYNKYKNAFRETQKLTNTAIEKWRKNPITLWEFEESFFRFKFYGGDYKINWESFKYYNVTDKTLFFGFHKNDNHYTLSENEVGQDNFLKIIELVKRKIEENGINH